MTFSLKIQPLKNVNRINGFYQSLFNYIVTLSKQITEKEFFSFMTALCLETLGYFNHQSSGLYFSPHLTDCLRHIMNQPLFHYYQNCSHTSRNLIRYIPAKVSRSPSLFSNFYSINSIKLCSLLREADGCQVSMRQTFQLCLPEFSN